MIKVWGVVEECPQDAPRMPSGLLRRAEGEARVLTPILPL